LGFWGILQGFWGFCSFSGILGDFGRFALLDFGGFSGILGDFEGFWGFCSFSGILGDLRDFGGFWPIRTLSK
jgi:hypothetical protein